MDTTSNPDDYTIAWISALSIERVAAIAFLDERHPQLEAQDKEDKNTYTLGRIGRHNVVIAVLPKGVYGTASAATVANDLLRTFKNIRIGFLVGIGGGAPSKKNDIRLGDIVVSTPDSGTGGVYEYNYGKSHQTRSFEQTGFLNSPSQTLLNAVPALEGDFIVDGNNIQGLISQVLLSKPHLRNHFSGRPDEDSDVLFRSEVVHKEGQDGSCAKYCYTSDQDIVARSPRANPDNVPTIFYGVVASANQLMKDALLRDRLAAEKGVLCFEMEAAGLMNSSGFLVIRGICDYSDSHKNDNWQNYAAMAAAAYAKRLILSLIPSQVKTEVKLTVLKKAVTEVIRPIREDVQKIQQNTSRNLYRQWLAPADPVYNYDKALKTRHPGSGQWFLADHRYQVWQNDSNSVLWLSGIPGCGKTVLSSTVIEDLRAKTKGYKDHVTLFFYFDFNDTSKQSLDGAIRSLLVQISEQSLDAEQMGQDILKHHGNGSTQPTTRMLRDTFPKMLQACENIFLVLDALDECPQSSIYHQRHEIIEWLCSLRQANVSKLHLIITSRPEQDIIEEFEDDIPNESRVQLRTELVSADIEAYIDYCVQQDRRLSRWHNSKALQQEIKLTLSQKHNGMFRWVALQINEIQQCRTERQVKDALGSLPRTLNATYARMFKSLDSRFKHDATRLLQFLVYSERPLTVNEAIDAIAIEFEPEPRYAVDRRYNNPEDLLFVCSSFVTVVEGGNDTKTEGADAYDDYEDEDKDDDDDDYEGDDDDYGEDIESEILSLNAAHVGNGTGEVSITSIPKKNHLIQLSHFSVREYFISEEGQDEFATHFREVTCYTVIAKACMVYLLHFYNQIDGETTIDRDFLLFSARYWSEYARHADEDAQMQELVIEFYLGQKRPYLRALQLFMPDEQFRPFQPQSQGGSALYYAAYTGQFNTCQQLIARGEAVNASGGLLGSPLQAAVMKNHEQITKLLLDHQADVDIEGYFGTSLQAASARGQVQIVRLLLNYQADVNIEGYYGTALQAASARGQVQIVQLLLYYQVNVNIKGRNGTALQAPSVEDYEQIVQLLLDHHADINTEAGCDGTALQAASAQGYERIVRLLLDRQADVDVNTEESEYGTALQAASAKGYKRIVQLLLDHDADVNIEGGVYCTALQAASAEGHKQVVRLLLDYQADVNIEGGEFGTALQGASAEGHKQVVQLLLDHDADINIKGGKYGTALQAASAKGHERIVQLLLDHQADVNIRGGEYGTALQAASAHGHDSIVQLLLDYQADVNIRGGKYGTALQAASAHGHDSIVQLLLNYQANTSLHKCGRGTALQEASAGGYEQIVQMLLEAGVNSRDLDKALQRAASQGHEDIVQLLLDNHADVNFRGVSGTALEVAAAEGHGHIVQLLLEVGVDSKDLKKALQKAADWGHKRIVKLLQRHRADIDSS